MAPDELARDRLLVTYIAMAAMAVVLLRVHDAVCEPCRASKMAGGAPCPPRQEAGRALAALGDLILARERALSARRSGPDQP